MRRMETHITFQEGISQERKALVRGLIKRDLRKGGVLGAPCHWLIQRDLIQARKEIIIHEQERM